MKYMSTHVFPMSTRCIQLVYNLVAAAAIVLAIVVFPKPPPLLPGILASNSKSLPPRPPACPHCQVFFPLFPAISQAPDLSPTCTTVALSHLSRTVWSAASCHQHAPALVHPQAQATSATYAAAAAHPHPAHPPRSPCSWSRLQSPRHTPIAPTCTMVALSNLSRIVCSKLPSARACPPPDTGNVSDKCRNGCTPPLLLPPPSAALLLPGSRLLSTRGRTSCCPATPLLMLA